MSHNIPPLRTPIYVNGVMAPEWWKFFSELHRQAESIGSAYGADDIKPTVQPFDSDSIIQLSILLAQYAARNDELEKIVDQSSYGRPNLGYTPVNVSGDKMHGTLTLFKGEAGRGPLYFQDGTLKDTPVAGDMEYSSGHWYLTNGARHAISTSAGVKTSTTTVANTVTETTLYSYEFAAGELHADEIIQMVACGIYSNASAADDYTIWFSLNGTHIHSAARIGGNVTDQAWKSCFAFTMRADGASGSFVDFAEYYDGSNFYVSADATTHSIDTTTTNEFAISIEWDNAKAGNTISCDMGVVRIEH